MSISLPDVFVTLHVYYPNSTLFTTIVNQTDIFGFSSLSFNLSSNSPGLYSYFLSANKLYYGSLYSERYFFNFIVRDNQYPYLLVLDNFSYDQANKSLEITGKVLNFDQNVFLGYLYVSVFDQNNIPYKTENYLIEALGLSINYFKFNISIELNTGISKGQFYLKIVYKFHNREEGITKLNRIPFFFLFGFFLFKKQFPPKIMLIGCISC